MNFYDLQKTEAFALIEKTLRRERLQKLIVGISSFVFGIILTSSFPFKPNEWFLGILTVVFLVVGMLVIIRLIQDWKLEKMELMRLLKYESSEIVWVYHLETSRLPFGIQFRYDCTMYFKLMNRDFIQINLPKAKIKMVSEILNRVLPHATFGYSIDNAQWYAANPALLLKD